MKILIVDDSAKIRQVIMQMLKNAEIEFTECDDGEDALKAFERSWPEYVFMDVAMKKMDGLVATKTILDRYPDARIIMVTNYNDQTLMKAAKEAGAIGYVLKDHLEELRKYIAHRPTN